MSSNLSAKAPAVVDPASLESPSVEPSAPVRTPRRFIAVPAEEIGVLRDALGLYLASPRVDEVLRVFGRRLGRSVAVWDPDAPEVASAICTIGAQLGLGKLSARDADPSPAGARGLRPEDWTVRIERSLEMSRAGEGGERPVFTAGFLEGLFEGMLGGRVHGELELCPSGSWELRVRPLPPTMPRDAHNGRARLPESRAYRFEAGDATSFFTHVSRAIVPGATLGFTRDSPRRLRSEFGLIGAELHWFATTYRPGELVLPPRQVGAVVEVVESFLCRHERPALVFLQGLDFLLSRNDAGMVVRMVQIVRERVVSAGATLVVEIPREGIEPESAERLRRELPAALPHLD